MKRFFLAFLFLFLAADAQATTRYVNSSCTNGITTYNPTANTCTGGSSTVYSSIGNGLASTVAGEVLDIRTGTYTENILESQLVNSGTSYSNAVTIQGHAAETVTINGHVRISSPGTGTTIQYIIFKHLVLDGTSQGADQDGVSLGGGGNGGAVQFIKFDDVEVKNFTGSGITSGGDDSVGQNIWITNSKVHDGGSGSLGFRHGVYMQSSDSIIENTQIYNYQGYGIHNYGNPATPSRNIYRNNKIHGTGLYDGHVAYGILLAVGDSNQAYNNLVYNNQEGIDAASSSNVVYNNTLYGNGVGFAGVCCYEAITNFSGSGNKIINNLLVGNQINSINTTGSTNTTLTTNRTGDTAAATFVNAAGGDFHLLVGAPAINAAVNLSSIFITDFDGNLRPSSGAWDVGAFEFGSFAGSTLVASYSFDNTAIDNSGNHNDAILGTGVTYATGHTNQAISLPGTTAGTVTVPFSSSLWLQNGFTLELWLKLASTVSDFAPLIQNQDDLYNGWFLYAGSTGYAQAGAPIGGYTASAPDVFAASPNNLTTSWTHVALTYDRTLPSANLKLYINGSQAATADGTNSLATWSGFMYIGSSPFNEVLPAGTLIDDVRVYKGARTPQEILVDMNNAVPSSVTQLTLGSGGKF